MTRWVGKWPGTWEGSQEATGPQFADMAATIVAGATVTATAFIPTPAVTYFGGGTNADREWFEREEAEERERQRQEAERILEAVRSLPETAPEARAASRASDALLTLATPVPAPLRRNGAGPRLTFAMLADAIRAWTAERDRQAAEEAERQAIAFAIEQQRLAEEAAALQLALDDEAAEALFALLMND